MDLLVLQLDNRGSVGSKRSRNNSKFFLMATVIDLMLLLFFFRVFFMIWRDLDCIVNAGCLGFVEFFKSWRFYFKIF